MGGVERVLVPKTSKIQFIIFLKKSQKYIFATNK
jgi:hypothetical protein